MASKLGPLYHAAVLMAGLKLLYLVLCIGVLHFLFTRKQTSECVRSLPGPWCKSIRLDTILILMKQVHRTSGLSMPSTSIRHG
jgi:hypothetical protein